MWLNIECILIPYPVTAIKTHALWWLSGTGNHENVYAHRNSEHHAYVPTVLTSVTQVLPSSLPSSNGFKTWLMWFSLQTCVWFIGIHGHALLSCWICASCMHYILLLTLLLLNRLTVGVPTKGKTQCCPLISY